jgi:hypothetical protein
MIFASKGVAYLLEQTVASGLGAVGHSAVQNEQAVVVEVLIQAPAELGGKVGGVIRFADGRQPARNRKAQRQADHPEQGTHQNEVRSIAEEGRDRVSENCYRKG